MKRMLLPLFLGVFALGIPLLQADTLRLSSGEAIEGTYLGGDARSVKFLDSDGNVNNYSLSKVASLSFGTQTAESAEEPQRQQEPQRQTARAPRQRSELEQRTSAEPASGVTIPAGTAVTVRMIDSIDSDISGQGEQFRASVDDPIVADGKTVVPRGADATVQIVSVEQAGTLTGADEVGLKLASLTVGGKTYDLTTNYAEVKSEGKGKSTAKTTAVTTGIGAVIGAIAGGGKGAAIGAGAGAGTGVAISAARGKRVQIPSETRLDFTIRSDLRVE